VQDLTGRRGAELAAVDNRLSINEDIIRSLPDIAQDRRMFSCRTPDPPAVATAIIGGQIVMEDRKLRAIDEKEVMAKARASAAELWERF
jgi:hypothetical protein